MKTKLLSDTNEQFKKNKGKAKQQSSLLEIKKTALDSNKQK